ncbi:MAG: hypothetical protein JXB49_05250 [Bacteroidales bacterium]|nr:hypothetical protein [Bacteroidales bacterium]
METVEYNSLDNRQFEKFQSIPDKEKSNRKIWGYIALVSIAAVVGYLIGKSRREIKLRNPIAFKNSETKDSKSSSSHIFST